MPTQARQSVTREIGMLHLRANVRPSSVDTEARTADLIFTTEAPVRRNSWMDGPFDEVLSLDKSAVRMERINNGAPLLNAHSSWELGDQIGVVENARIENAQLVGTVRFSKRDDVEAIFQDVRDGIIRNVSIGYAVHKFEQVSGGDDEIPVYRATDWEPYEVSLVPMGADDSAKVRARGQDSDARRWPCLIVNNSRGATAMSEEAIQEQGGTQGIAPGAAGKERARILGIQKRIRVANLGDEFAQRLIDSGASLDKASELILAEMADKGDALPTRSHGGVEASILRDGHDSLLEGAKLALIGRMNPSAKAAAGGFELVRAFTGRSMLEIGRLLLESRGVRTDGLSRMRLAAAVLGMERAGGMHSTSDFPLLLADAAGKVLRDMYQAAPRTFLPLAKKTTARDFKMMKRLQIGEAPALLKVLEGAEFTRGSIGEGREQYAIQTFGRILGFTRQMLINDDLDAFSRILTLFARASAHLESDLCWEQITSNPDMSDGVDLFHTDHGNVSGAAAAISITTLSAARASMRAQKDLGGTQYLNIAPKVLIVPTALETVAGQQTSSQFVPAQQSNISPFAGLTVIAEPRLDANSATVWYLGADPGQIDMLEYAYLEGEEGPFIETRDGFETDGTEVKCRHDFAAKIIDWRGFYRNAA